MMDRDGMMDMNSMLGMGAMMFIGLLILAVILGVAVYVAVRAALRRHSATPTPRETLQQRLAAGEIGPEEYYERDSALRESRGSSPSG